MKDSNIVNNIKCKVTQRLQVGLPFLKDKWSQKGKIGKGVMVLLAPCYLISGISPPKWRKVTFITSIFFYIMFLSVFHDDFEAGNRHFNNKNYSEAIYWLEKIEEDHENYKGAQSLLSIAKIKLEEQVLDTEKGLLSNAKIQSEKGNFKGSIDSLNKIRSDSIYKDEADVLLANVKSKLLGREAKMTVQESKEKVIGSRKDLSSKPIVIRKESILPIIDVMLYKSIYGLQKKGMKVYKYQLTAIKYGLDDTKFIQTKFSKAILEEIDSLLDDKTELQCKKYYREEPWISFYKLAV